MWRHHCLLMPPGKKTKNTLACVFTVANVLGSGSVFGFWGIRIKDARRFLWGPPAYHGSKFLDPFSLFFWGGGIPLNQFKGPRPCAQSSVPSGLHSNLSFVCRFLKLQVFVRQGVNDKVPAKTLHLNGYLRRTLDTDYVFIGGGIKIMCDALT